MTDSDIEEENLHDFCRSLKIGWKPVHLLLISAQYYLNPLIRHWSWYWCQSTLVDLGGGDGNAKGGSTSGPISPSPFLVGFQNVCHNMKLVLSTGNPGSAMGQCE